jgi:two-component system chemotaxis response regulator CheB
VLLAPGHMHMKLRRAHGELVVLCVAEIEGHLYRPSVDVLMSSAAELLGADAIGVMLTGMGEDGAKGLLQMRQAGAHTVAQDEQSSAVYGMPRAAALAGAAERVKPLDEIGELLQRWVRDHGRRAA